MRAVPIISLSNCQASHSKIRHQTALLAALQRLTTFFRAKISKLSLEFNSGKGKLVGLGGWLHIKTVYPRATVIQLGSNLKRGRVTSITCNFLYFYNIKTLRKNATSCTRIVLGLGQRRRKRSESRNAKQPKNCFYVREHNTQFCYTTKSE